MRVPLPFFRKQTASWYVEIRGKQVPLGPDREAAWQKYHEVMAGHREMAPSSPVVDVLDQFLVWVANNQAPKTLEFYKRYLDSFGRYLGTRVRVQDLKAYHVTRWVDQDFGSQSDTSKHGAFRSVQRAFNWAKKQGIIQTSPVEHLDKPTPGRRETYLTPEQYAIVLDRIREYERGEGPFFQLVVALWDSGCRPQEVRKVEAKHYDPSRMVWVFERVNSKGKKRRRVVHLTPKLNEICARLAAANPSGPMFRNGKGRPWTSDALNCRFRHLSGIRDTRKVYKKPRKKREPRPQLGFPICAYSFRHGFATQRLKSGVDTVTVARLMGHTTTRMLETVYAHVDADDAHMQAALTRTNGTGE